MKDRHLILELFVAAQGIVVIIVGLAFLLIDPSGVAPLSAMAAGGAVFSSNLLMLVWMRVRTKTSAVAGPPESAFVLAAHFLKLLLSSGLLLASLVLLPTVDWVGFLVGLCSTLMAIFFVPFVATSQLACAVSQRDFQQRVRAIAGQ